MRFKKYLLIYFIPLIIYFSFISRGIYTYTAVFILFVIIPLFELLFKGTTENFAPEIEETEKDNPVYNLILFSIFPLQFLLLICFLIQVSDDHLQVYERIGMIIAMGLSCGILGINVAHELGHRSTPYEQWMSKFLLMTSLYMHFFIEHNKGHHKNVSTDEDPASSRIGESLYAFYRRSIMNSWKSAWQIEKRRLDKLGGKTWSFQNEMIQFIMIQTVFCLCIWSYFGLTVFLSFLIAAVLGFHLLETVNYIQHYGLRRKKRNEDDYDRTLPIHSWNANESFGRILLFEMTRHSDHHYKSNRAYQILRHHDESPQMPTGYPGMMILALIPPLWFKVMNQRIERMKESLSGEGLS